MSESRMAGALAIGLVLASASAARAQGVGAGGDLDAGAGGAAGGGGGGGGAPEGIQPTTTPDNYGCAAVGRRDVGGSGAALVAVAIAIAVARSRRRRARVAASLACAAAFATPTVASAAQDAERPDRPPPPVEPARHVAITWNPFTLQVSRYGGTVEVTPVDHHALAATLFYMHTVTNEDSRHNVFRGVGGELGYRWYSGRGGARGLFVGPSLLAGFYDAVPARGASVPFQNLGGALDAGYQAMLAGVVVGLGAGLQYTAPTVTFPAQELPASIYAIRGLRPRLLLALGYSF